MDVKPSLMALALGLGLGGCAAPAMQELAVADMLPRGDAAAAETPAFTVYFEVGSAALTADASGILDRLVADPARPGWSRITLSGYADRSGSARLNRRLSIERVETVRRYLVDAGVPADRIVVAAFGERQARRGIDADDRRVEIFVSAG
jgi:outer membrane protein OmpA-like peptidoglycan-associated protein